MITYILVAYGRYPFFFDLNQPKIEDCLYPKKNNLQKKQKGKREKKKDRHTNTIGDQSMELKREKRKEGAGQDRKEKKRERLTQDDPTPVKCGEEGSIFFSTD